VVLEPAPEEELLPPLREVVVQAQVVPPRRPRQVQVAQPLLRPRQVERLQARQEIKEQSIAGS